MMATSQHPPRGDGEPHAVVFLFDVDNTLLDNDRVTEDLRRHLGKAVGPGRHQRYWEIFEELRRELGYADYLGALQRLRQERPDEPALLEVSLYMLDYHFANRLFPDSLDVVEHVRTWGPAAIVSDGDAVFQPRKIEDSGLFDAFDGNVLIYIHKEQVLADIERRFPAAHYVLFDDKVRILAAFKAAWGSRVTTVFPRQGHYALDPELVAAYPAADVTVQRIGDVLALDLEAFVRAARGLESADA
jgi:FMN phosphatase YigB (HAD superfamily)